MVEGMIEELKRVLKCPICSNVLDDARVLKCGHTFCYLCIKQNYESHQLNKGNCPVCGENYFLKERDTRHLSKAFIVNNVLDIVKVPTVCKCAFCQTDDGTHICLKCKLNVCRYCSKRSMSFCTHQTVTMEYLNSDPFLQAIIQCSKSKPMCPSHREEEVNNFCQNCKRVICEECINEAHRHHTVLGLQEAVNQIRGGNILQLLERKTHELEMFLTKLGTISADTRTDVIVVNPTEQEQRLCESNRDECSLLHQQMRDVFMYGSGQAILKSFYDRANRINKLLDYKPEQELFFMRDSGSLHKSKYSQTRIQDNSNIQQIHGTLYNF